MKTVMVFLAATLSAGCAITASARIYNLDSAEVMQASFRYTGSGKGPISVMKPNGTACAGEYVTVAGGSVGWGAIFGTVYSAAGSGTGSGTVITSQMDLMQRGAAVARCDDDMVVECEYLTVAGRAQGFGACKDNRNGRYRLMF